MKRALIIGGGGIGKRHIRGFLKTGRVQLALVEPRGDIREDAGRTYDIRERVPDIADLDLTAFDLAVICAPAHVHVPLARQCAEAGLPFLLEKPLAVTMEGVDELVRTVDEKNLVTAVGYIYRTTPWYRALHDELAAGRIGTPRMALIQACQEYPKYRPDYRDIYYAKEAMGGGAILDCASHLIDLVLWLMGPVSEVSCLCDRLVLDGVECEDSALISLRLASGSMAQVSINQFQKPNSCWCDIAGTEGNLKVVSTDGTLQFADNDSGEWIVTEFITGKTAMEIHEDNFGRQADMFLDRIEGRESDLATLREARDNLRIALAAKESNETRRTVVLRDE